MRNITRVACVGIGLFMLLATSAIAEKTIQLTDGTVIQGTPTALSNGEYTIQTEKLGELKISEEDILQIKEAGLSAEPTLQEPDLSAQMQQIQAQIVNNPQIMQDVQSLMNDPQIMEAIQDPAFMEAVMSQDLKRIQNDPNTQKLMNNPNMQGVVEKIQKAQ